MSKKNIFIGFILLLTLFILFGQGNRKKINWFPSYSYHHKIPFGTYVFYHLLKENLNTSLNRVDLTPYQYLKNTPNTKGNFIFINSQLQFGEANLDKLLKWVKNGNNLFLYATKFDKALEDSLHIKISPYIDLKNDSLWTLNFVNESLRINKPLIYDRPHFNFSIITPDTITTSPSYQILGTINDSLVNFARFNYGEGKIYLHTTPEVLTNYFILNNNNYRYNEGLLSYLNNKQNIYWDTHYPNGAGNNGIFKVLINTPAFLWAYRLLIIGVVLFILFEGKRKQRPIPVVQPPTNESLNFIQTVAALFINKKEHKEMAEKRIMLFMDWLKNSLYLDITKPQSELINQIEKRTDLGKDEIGAVFDKMNEIQNRHTISAKEVLELEELINKIQHGI